MSSNQRVESGVFPVHANDFEVLVAGEYGSDDAVWESPAELEEISLKIDNVTETWNSFAQKGWQSALVTGKAAELSIKGKRCIGDRGNDLIASKTLKTGQDAYISARIKGADGTAIEWEKMACAVENDGKGGKATDAAPLEATLTAHGKPVETVITDEQTSSEETTGEETTGEEGTEE